MAEYYSRNMNGENFIQYMGEIGWPQDGEFAILLSAMGYHFYEKDGRMAIRTLPDWAASALSVLLSEL